MPRPTQTGGTIDPDLLRQREEEEERRKAAAAQAAKPKKKKETQGERPTRDPLAGVKQALSAADQNIENFVEEKIYRPIMGEKGLEDYRTRKGEAEKKNAEIQKEFEKAAYDGPINTFGSEAVRAVVNAPVNLLEGVLNTGELIKDSIGTGINAIRGKATPDTRNPFSNRYEEAVYDLGVQGTKTSVGNLAEGILTFGLGLRAIGARLPTGATGLGTGGKGLKGAVASGIVPGAIADLLLTKGSDANLSTLVRDLDWVPPEHEDTFLLALAVDSDDNPWEVRLKTLVEGGVTGAAADALGWILFGRRAAQKALKAGKSKEEAVEAGIRAADEAANKADTTAAQRAADEDAAWDEVRGDEYNKLRDEEEEASRIADKVLADFGEDSPEYAEALKNLEAVSAKVADFDWEEIRRTDPQGLDPSEKSAYTEVADPTDAVATRVRLEEGGLPRPARTNPAANAPGGTSPTIGSAPKVLTDAAYRIMNMEEGAEKIVKGVTSRIELERLARKLKRSSKQVVESAARMVEEFRDYDKKAGDTSVSIPDLLARQGGTITVDRGKGVETLLSPEGVVATKALISDTADQIYALTSNLDEMIQMRKAGGNQYDRLVDRLIGLVELHKLTGNFHGFGLRSFQDMIGGASTKNSDKSALTIAKAKEWGTRIKKLARQGDPKAQEELEQLVRLMHLAGGDPTKQVSFFSMASKVGVEGALKGMYQSMLSGPITHLRNLVGNTYATIERPLSVALNGYITGDEALKKASIAGMHAIRTGISDAWDIARVTWATGEATQVNKKFVLDDIQLQVQLSRMRQAAKTPSEELAVGFLEAQYRFLNNPWLSWPSRALMASDDFFKHLNARQKVASDAMYKAVMDAKDPNDVDLFFNKYQAEFSKQIDMKTGEIINDDLLEYAERATFQNDPGSFINSIALAIDNMPVAKIFVPFLRTPANMLAYAGQHTPGLNRFLGSYKEVMAGSDELLKAEMRGREAIGAFTIGAAGTLALSGLMTGNGPSDPEENALWLKTHQPRSLKVGNVWISYESIEPLASIMSTVADISMLARMGNQSMAEKLIGQTVYALTAAVTEKSMLAGLTGLAQVLDPKNLSSADRTVRGILATGNNFLPYAGARRSLANALDPYMKEVDNELQRALMGAIPLYKNTQPSRIDIFTGEQISALGGGVWNAFVPFRIKAQGEDPMVDTLVQMQFEYNQITKSGPKNEPLTAQEQATLSRLIYETGVRERIERVMEKDWFQQGVQDFLNRKGTIDKKQMRHYKAIDQLLSQAKASAFRRMKAQDEDFAERLTLRAQAQTKARRGDTAGAIDKLREITK